MHDRAPSGAGLLISLESFDDGLKAGKLLQHPHQLAVVIDHTKTRDTVLQNNFDEFENSGACLDRDGPLDPIGIKGDRHGRY